MAGLLDVAAPDESVQEAPLYSDEDRKNGMLLTFVRSMQGRDGLADGMQFIESAVQKKKALRTQQDTSGLLSYLTQAAQAGAPVDPGVLQRFRYATPEAAKGLLTQVQATRQRKQELADVREERGFQEGLLQKKGKWEVEAAERKAEKARLDAEEAAAEAEQARTAIGLLSRGGAVRKPAMLPPRATNPGLLNSLQRPVPQQVAARPVEQIGTADVQGLLPNLRRPATAVQAARQGMLEEAKGRADIGAQEALATQRNNPVTQQPRSNEAAFYRQFLTDNPGATMDEARQAYIDFQASLSGARAGAAAAATDYRTTYLPFTDEQGRPLAGDRRGNVRPAETGTTVPMAKPTEGDKAFAGVSEGIKGSIARIRENFDPGYVGPVQGRFGTLMGKVKDLPPAQAKFYADILSVGDTELRRRSGAAITPSEMERILQFAPNPNAPSGNFMQQLDRFETELNDIIRARNEARKGKPLQPSGGAGGKAPASSAADLVDSWLK